MTNYMGKRRLLNILLQMLSDRPELQERIKKIPNLLGYGNFRGSEWLDIELEDYRFKVYADGAPGKVVSFEEYRINEYGEIGPQYNRILTKYNENFEPVPLATWFSGGCVLRKSGYYPFQPEWKYLASYSSDEAAGLNPNSFVCYNIAKQAHKAQDPKDVTRELEKMNEDVTDKHNDWNVDMWYGDKKEEADKITVAFYDRDCEYRGNVYKNGKAIGDFAVKDSLQLEKLFPQIDFNWDHDDSKSADHDEESSDQLDR